MLDPGLWTDQQVRVFDPMTDIPQQGKPPTHPDHRWRRAHYLLMHRRKPWKRLDDPITSEASQFVWALKRAYYGPSGGRLPSQFPVLNAAYKASRDLYPCEIAELKSRLLANEPDEHIAARYHMTPAGIRAYHDLFFDVQAWLKDERYIADVALTECLGAQSHHRSLLILFAYALGGKAIDGLLDYFDHPANGAGQEPDPAEQRRLRWRSLIEVAIDALNVPSTRPATVLLVNLVRQLRDLGRDLVETGDISGQPQPGLVRAVNPSRS